MRALLDVNAVLALLDSAHLGHSVVADWFVHHASDGWATCPITENGFARIASQQSYPNAVSTAQALATLRRATEASAHEFWPCDTSIVDQSLVAPNSLLSPGQLTDVYLLSLAVKHQGRLVTLDRRINTDAVHGATDTNLVVL